MSTPYPNTPTAESGIDANNNITGKSLYNSATGSQAGNRIAFDGSVLDSSDKQRAEITDYVRMRLGDGIVDVELDKEHYEMAIKQALVKYRQKAQNAVEESYAFLQLRPETQEYILPREIQTVRAVFRRGIGSVAGTTASQFEPFASGYLNTYMLQAGRVGGLVNYELFSQYQELVMTMFGGYINFTFNPVTRKFTIVRKIPWQGANPPTEQQETVLLWIYNTKPDQMLFNDTYAFPWLQEYAYSFAKRIIGEARSKFSSIAGPSGGGQLNGDALKQEAVAEMEKLEEDLKNYVDGSQPLTWVTG